VRETYFYPACALSVLGCLARTCKAFARDLTLNHKCFNWLPSEWHRKYESIRRQAYQHFDNDTLPRAWQFIIHRCIRPSGYFKKVGNAGKRWEILYSSWKGQWTDADDVLHNERMFQLRVFAKGTYETCTDFCFNHEGRLWHHLPGGVYKNPQSLEKRIAWEINNLQRYMGDEVALKLEEAQLAEAKKAIPPEALPNSDVNQQLRVDYYKKKKEFQERVERHMMDSHVFLEMSQALAAIANEACPELAVMRAKLDKLEQWNEYAWITDYMVQYYPKSKRAREHLQRQAREAEEKK